MLNRRNRSLTPFLVIAALVCCLCPNEAQAAVFWYGTRVTGPEQHHRQGEGRYPFREKADYIMKELDLRRGDVVVDIGAGDGWWTERFAKKVGKKGSVYAAEVTDKLVDGLKEKFARMPRVKPYKCPLDGTGLEKDSCDLAFFSQVFHHIDEDGQTDYLRHLRDVVKPPGRLAIIERYVEVVSGRPGHGTKLSGLVAKAEEAGWVPVRYELIPNTYHYLTIFVQKELFPPEPERRRGGQRGEQPPQEGN